MPMEDPHQDCSGSLSRAALRGIGVALLISSFLWALIGLMSSALLGA
jgi:hypothetical protein